jgi:hypothetical protein
VGTDVDVGGRSVEISISSVSVDLAWDINVAGISVEVGVFRERVLVGSSRPGPRGVVNCALAFGYRTAPAITKTTIMMPINPKKRFRLDVCITIKFLKDALVNCKSSR